MRSTRAVSVSAPQLSLDVRRHLMRDQCPPAILDSAVVLRYAVHSDAITYTGRGGTYYGDRLVGPNIKRSAICQNLLEPHDFLFCYCADDWTVEAVAGHDTLEAAFAYATRMYSGVEGVMLDSPYSSEEIDAAIAAYWDGQR